MYIYIYIHIHMYLPSSFAGDLRRRRDCLCELNKGRPSKGEHKALHVRDALGDTLLMCTFIYMYIQIPVLPSTSISTSISVFMSVSTAIKDEICRHAFAGEPAGSKKEPGDGVHYSAALGGKLFEPG